MRWIYDRQYNQRTGRVIEKLKYCIGAKPLNKLYDTWKLAEAEFVIFQSYV